MSALLLAQAMLHSLRAHQAVEEQVTKAALQNAVSVAQLLLTTDALIATKPEPKKKGGAPGRSSVRNLGPAANPPRCLVNCSRPIASSTGWNGRYSPKGTRWTLS